MAYKASFWFVNIVKFISGVAWIFPREKKITFITSLKTIINYCLTPYPSFPEQTIPKMWPENAHDPGSMLYSYYLSSLLHVPCIILLWNLPLNPRQHSFPAMLASARSFILIHLFQSVFFLSTHVSNFIVIFFILNFL